MVPCHASPNASPHANFKLTSFLHPTTPDHLPLSPSLSIFKMAFRQIQASNAEVETYIKRLSSYSLAFENCAARLRKTRTPEQIKVVHNRALAEWQDKANGFPSQYVPKAGTPEWHAMWKKLNNIFTSTPKTDRE